MSDALMSFLDVLESFVADVEGRVPDYFTRQPLRSAAPLDALCCGAMRAWGRPAVSVADECSLNAVDRHLCDRLSALDLHGIELPDEAFLTAFRAERVRRREEARACVAATAARLERHEAGGVSRLTYFAAGRGVPVIAVNAIGQAAAPWLPLVDHLARRYRIVVMPIRETGTFADHCRDLHAIVRQERASEVHLIGWCTGAKLAARYARTFGGVRSMVLLSGSFKHPQRAPDHDTPYERNLESVLRTVVRQPALAERLRAIFAQNAFDAARLDDQALAVHALAAPPAALEPEIRRPFADSDALTTYARQHVEFWSHDETAAAAEVVAPVLGIAGEHDAVVLPAGFRDALAHFPRAEYRELAGTAHYALYERAGLLARWIGEWSDCAKVRSHAAAGVLESHP